jgi:hypothetical protein
MILGPLLLVAAAGGVVSLAAGRWGRGGRVGTVIGLGALMLAFIAALATSTTGPDALTNAGQRSPFDALLVSTSYVRLTAILWSAFGLLLATLAALTGRVPGLAGATLVGLAAAVIALAASDVLVAVLAAIVAGLGGLLVSAPEPAGDDPRRGVPAPRRPRALGPSAGPSAIVAVAARELRSVVLAGVAVAGGVVLVAIAATRPPGSEGGAASLVQAAPIVGAAALAIAAGVAVRSGAIPFHLWAARVADVAPAAALPLLLAWTPVVLAAVAVAAWDARLAPLGLPLDAERWVLVGVGVLTLVAGTLAALVQDDLEHIVGYLVIADGGLVLFGLATSDPASVAPSLAWLLVLAASKSALGAWAVAIASRSGSRRLPDLRGWARRSPLLAVAFLLTAVATFGLPGWLAWEVRRSMPALATGEALGAVLWLATLAVAIPYARVLGAGLDHVTSTVAGVAGDRPVLTTMPTMGGRRGRAAAAELGGGLATALRANRALVVAGLAVACAVLAVIVAAGGFGLADAASEAPPAVRGVLPE